MLVLTAPLQVAVALAILRRLGRPIIFRQQRAGYLGRTFTLFKFRTMLPPDPARGLTADADRLTPLGLWLRRTSIDELPSLWNVLRGEMSLVGPRPLLPHYLPLYSPAEARRHEAPPGLTGLAQVSGRNAMSWQDRFAADVDYVDRRSLKLDAWIVARTVSAVIRREGINAPGEATMPEFRGSLTPPEVP